MIRGRGVAKQWDSDVGSWNVFNLIDYLKENYNIDEDWIILQGHSFGAQGALYLACDDRACFRKLVLVSAYDSGCNYRNVTIPIRGYSGDPFKEGDKEDINSYVFMERIFPEVFGRDNWFIRPVSHDEIPEVAFQEDLDNNGKSDLVEWMLSE